MIETAVRSALRVVIISEHVKLLRMIPSLVPTDEYVCTRRVPVPCCLTPLPT
jgi:hypothetical protein